MDPVSAIVAALAAGATAALKDSATDAIKSAYDGLKGLVRARFAAVNVEPHEARPDSEPRRAMVAEDLAEAGAAEDAELLAAAKALLDHIAAQGAEGAAAIGVDLKEVEAANLVIEGVISSGHGIKAEKIKPEGDIRISGVTAGGAEGGSKN